ncbi:MAG: DegV family protein [Lactobacillus sp.]|uniref:DegV family protein n=1 Tax=Bombilactobacillus bombi TaxID=1303590 RepID=A0A347SR85_9LACO|nr:DegV family protein [Bombilactobacillus bombi]AXX64544.1 DegV family protein [Bombilactobacillus bombi]MCO6541293.1 DegV family protein [Lactobacillus sp.]MCO6542895.1 DegV family protein [Lactobacillus sp.]RHW45958.1 DegV family protein [Bombilactobacillus bombi]
MKIAVVTDSSSYLSKEEAKENNIYIISIPVIIEDQVYHEGVDITTKEFYERVRNLKELPKTSQPEFGELNKLYDQLADKGYDAVISIHLASTISGLINSLNVLSKTKTNIKIIPYDSHITVRLMGYLALEAARMANAGKDLETILARLDDLRSTIDENIIVNDLTNLVKGGRLSNASAVIGTMLNIKPLLTFDDQTDEIVAYEKVRSIKKAYLKSEQRFAKAQAAADFPYRLIVIDANDQSENDIWTADLQKKFPNTTIEQSYFGPVIGTHLGEKAVALGWIKDFEKV